MGDMDQGIKRLFQVAPSLLISFLVNGCEYLETLPTDIAIESQLILDTLFRVLYQGIECLLNIEIQSSFTKDMARRCFDYAKRASFIYKLPVMSVVLWLRKTGTMPSMTYEERVGDRLLGTWNVFSIAIYDLQARDMINAGVIGLLPLVPFMQGADLATIEEAAEVMQTEAPTELQNTFTVLLAIFTAQFHGNEAAEALMRRLKVSTDILNESPLYRAWVETAKAEGKAEGLAEGKTLGLRLAALRLLESRFTTLDADLVDALQTADEVALDAIILHVSTDTLAEIRARLGLS